MTTPYPAERMGIWTPAHANMFPVPDHEMRWRITSVNQSYQGNGPDRELFVCGQEEPADNEDEDDHHHHHHHHDNNNNNNKNKNKVHPHMVKNHIVYRGSTKLLVSHKKWPFPAGLGPTQTLESQQMVKVNNDHHGHVLK